MDMPFFRLGKRARLGVSGVPGLSGGSIIPFSLSDDFSSDSGLWLDGNGDPATLDLISNNRADYNVAVGAATLDEGFDTWVGDDPAGWYPQQGDTANYECTERSSDQLHADGPAGTGAANWWNDGIAGSGPGFSLNQKTRYAWNRCDIVCSTYGAGGLIAYEHGATPHAELCYVTAAGTFVGGDYWESANPFRLQINNGDAPADLTLSSTKLYPVTLVDMVRVQPMTEISWVSVNVWWDGSPKGDVMWKDSSNYLVIYPCYLGQTQQNVLRMKAFSGGTMVIEQEANITYVPGSSVQIVPNNTFTGFAANYGGSEVIAEQALDWSADVGADGKSLTGWYIGLFNLYNSGNVNTAAFGSFQTQSVF